jgi:hypothetical protein
MATFDETDPNLIMKIWADPAGGNPRMPVGEKEGQRFKVQMIYRFVETGTIPAGYRITPIELNTENGHGFAALHLAIHDFEFALECFKRAHELGRPDETNVECKALINAGVTSYARPFSEGVRGVRLDPEMFTEVWGEDDVELHNFLFDVRNKHIAHSVNEFERCETVGMVVFSPERQMLEGVSGVGVILYSRIGINAQKLEKAIHHTEFCINHLNHKLDDLRPDVHAEMKADLRNGWKIAPLMKLDDPGKEAVRVSRRRLPRLHNVLARLKQQLPRRED